MMDNREKPTNTSRENPADPLDFAFHFLNRPAHELSQHIAIDRTRSLVPKLHEHFEGVAPEGERVFALTSIERVLIDLQRESGELFTRTTHHPDKSEGVEVVLEGHVNTSEQQYMTETRFQTSGILLARADAVLWALWGKSQPPELDVDRVLMEAVSQFVFDRAEQELLAEGDKFQQGFEGMKVLHREIDVEMSAQDLHKPDEGIRGEAFLRSKNYGQDWINRAWEVAKRRRGILAVLSPDTLIEDRLCHESGTSAECFSYAPQNSPRLADVTALYPLGAREREFFRLIRERSSP